MIQRQRLNISSVVMLIAFLIAACGKSAEPTTTSPAGPTPDWAATNQAIVAANATFAAAQEATDIAAANQAILATNTAVVAAMQATNQAVATQEATLMTPVVTADPTATPTPLVVSWYPPGALAMFASGDYERQDLYALFPDGSTETVFENVTRDTIVSPDGRWLATLRYGEQGSPDTWQLHDAWGGQARIYSSAPNNNLFRAAFDRAGRRLAYLEIGNYSEQGVPWELVMVDLESGEVARYTASMGRSETGIDFLPGEPVGWSGLGDELILDTFLPYTEGGWAGVWGVSLPSGGVSVPLDELNRRQLVDPAPTYFSDIIVSPEGVALAYLGRNTEYVPQNYTVEYVDAAVNRLEFVDLADGSRHLLIEVEDGSALAGDAAWSPDGQRLLFAQGLYDGPNFAGLAIKSIHKDEPPNGEVLNYGRLSLPDQGGVGRLAWCRDLYALYSTWDYQGMNRLYVLNLATGVSTEAANSQTIEIVGCAP